MRQSKLTGFLAVIIVMYTKSHRQSFIEECIVHDLAWLLSIILMLNVLVQTVNIICGVVTMFNLYIPE